MLYSALQFKTNCICNKTLKFLFKLLRKSYTYLSSCLGRRTEIYFGSFRKQIRGGNGWAQALINANIASSGTAYSFFKINVL